MKLALIDQINDTAFRHAVGLMDAGDAEGLRAHLVAHPGLVTQRVQLDPGYFEAPALICFIAENPIRNGTMPANVTDIAGVLIDAGAPASMLTEALVLVASGWIARKSGAQTPLIIRLCSAGADPDTPLMPALDHGEFTAVAALIAAGATPTPPVAAATGNAAESRHFFPDANALHRHQSLALAAQYGHVNTLELLFNAGEDPNRFNPHGCHAHSPVLHQAALAG